MAANQVSGVDIPNEMIVQIPITANRHLSCLACVRANRDGKYLYVTIMHNKPTDSIIAELRCSHCNQLQENPLVSQMAHMYSAYLITKREHDQLVSTNYGHQITIANINNMCVVYRQHLDKLNTDHINLIECYNTNQQKLIELTEKYNKSQVEIANFQSEIENVQSEIKDAQAEIEKLKSQLVNTESKQSNELARLNTQLSDSNTQLSDNNKQYSNALENVTSLKSRNTVLEKANRSFESQNTEFKSRNTVLEKANKLFESKNMELKSQITVLEKANKSFESQNTELKKSNIDIRRKYNEIEKRMRVLDVPDIVVERYTKLVQVYEAEIVDLRNRLSKSENNYNKYKDGQKDRCLAIVNEYTRRYEIVKQKSREDYLALELRLAKQYKTMLEEQGVDKTYKHVISEKYRVKLSLLEFAQRNPDFGKIQHYMNIAPPGSKESDVYDMKIQDPHGMLDLN